MFVSVLPFLLLISSTQAGYYGAVSTYSSLDSKGSYFTLRLRFETGFSSCGLCGGNCYGAQKIDNSTEWCLQEETTYNPYATSFWGYSTWVMSYGNWTENKNGIVESKAMMRMEYRLRSDTNETNSSPQTTVLPSLRIPSNCQKNIDLLTFDPDGDRVECRFAVYSYSYYTECIHCTPPSVLNLSSSCSLSFSPTNSSYEGSYAVQLMMEDFPRENINLTYPAYYYYYYYYYYYPPKEVKTTDAISKIPVQFLFKVDPAAPSCTEGLYLPKFLPPTPNHKSVIIATESKTLEISIRAEATQAVITELLFSGPHSVAKSQSGSGNFTLRWTPTFNEIGHNIPICFVVRANSSSSVYESELRCVTVTVQGGPSYVAGVSLRISTSQSLEKSLQETYDRIRQLLRIYGIQADVGIDVVSIEAVKETP